MGSGVGTGVASGAETGAGLETGSGAETDEETEDAERISSSRLMRKYCSTARDRISSRKIRNLTSFFMKQFSI